MAQRLCACVFRPRLHYFGCWQEQEMVGFFAYMSSYVYVGGQGKPSHAHRGSQLLPAAHSCVVDGARRRLVAADRAKALQGLCLARTSCGKDEQARCNARSSCTHPPRFVLPSGRVWSCRPSGYRRVGHWRGSGTDFCVRLAVCSSCLCILQWRFVGVYS